jgi:hypothetical protein
MRRDRETVGSGADYGHFAVITEIRLGHVMLP